MYASVHKAFDQIIWYASCTITPSLHTSFIVLISSSNLLLFAVTQNARDDTWCLDWCTQTMHKSQSCQIGAWPHLRHWVQHLTVDRTSFLLSRPRPSIRHCPTMSDPISCYGSRQTLTPPSDSALCLMRTAYARFLSDTTHCPMVTSVCRTTVPDKWIGAFMVAQTALCHWHVYHRLSSFTLNDHRSTSGLFCMRCNVEVINLVWRLREKYVGNWNWASAREKERERKKYTWKTTASSATFQLYRIFNKQFLCMRCFSRFVWTGKKLLQV